MSAPSWTSHQDPRTRQWFWTATGARGVSHGVAGDADAAAVAAKSEMVALEVKRES